MAIDLDDYKTVITQQRCIKDPKLSGGEIKLLSNGQPWRDTGGYCVVFKYQIKSGKDYAVRCWYNELHDIKDRTAAISAAIKRCQLPYFCEFEYIDKGVLTSKGIQPIIRMEWIEAKNLKEYIADNIKYPKNILDLMHGFYKMCCDLHTANISHGDLQHANIKVKPNKQLILLDYDSFYHPSMNRMSDYIHGKIDYQHPARNENSIAATYIDAFSELIIFTSLLYIGNKPEVYKGKIIDSDCLIFEAADYKNFNSSAIYKELVCYSETTAFLANIINDNLKINDLSKIDNIETAARKAAKAGLDIFNIKFFDLEALYNEAVKLRREGNVRAALDKLSILASKNHPMAILTMAQIFYNGEGVPRDMHRAILFYKSAISYFETQFEASKFLGLAYLNGIGVGTDYKSAKKYLGLAYSIQQDADVAAALSKLHNGLLETNLDKALEYIEIAKRKKPKYQPDYKLLIDKRNKINRQKKLKSVYNGILGFLGAVVAVIVVAGVVWGLYKGGSAIYSWGYEVYEQGVNYDNAISAGDKFVTEGNYVKAVEEYQKALVYKKSKKKQALANDKISEAQKKSEENIKSLLSKADAIIQANKTSAKYGVVNYDDPKSMLDRVIYLQPTNARASELLRVLEKQKKKK